MSYSQIADHSFAYNFVVTEAMALEIATFLISADGMGAGGLANGSSFAITAREDEGVRRLWLSMASFDRLRTLGRYDELLRQAMAGRGSSQQPSITCPRCKRTSYSPGDIENRYCGNCHMYHVDMNPNHLP